MIYKAELHKKNNVHSDKVVKQDQIFQANVDEVDQKIRKCFLITYFYTYKCLERRSIFNSSFTIKN
jgi:hypothetical protein